MTVKTLPKAEISIKIGMMNTFKHYAPWRITILNVFSLTYKFRLQYLTTVSASLVDRLFGNTINEN